MHTIRRPAAHESAAYFKHYISLVEGDDILAILNKAKTETAAFLRSIPDEKWDQAYAPGKWTLKESWMHLVDSERVFAYRAMRIARNDQTPMPGFDQDIYVPHYNALSRTAESVIQEYEAVRAASISLFEHLDDAAMNHIGTASNNPMSTLAAAFIIAGHEQHHINLINDKYL